MRGLALSLLLLFPPALHSEAPLPHSLRAPAPLPWEPPALAGLASLLAPSGDAALRQVRVELSVQALLENVTEQSHPDALRLAVQAYYNFRDTYPDYVQNPYFYFVDFGLDSRSPRGYVFHMETLRLVEGPFTVAHGRGSSDEALGIPTEFSNREGSAQTSLGLFLAQETYDFQGSAGGSSYQSLGMRLLGVSGRYNSAALARRIVVHGAPYVTPEKAGRSEGCPALEPERAHRLLPLLSNGGLVFLFSPQAADWMGGDPWVWGTGSRLLTSTLAGS